MFCKVFLKNFLVFLGKVLIFKVFRVESFFKVFFYKSEAWGLWGIWGVFLFRLSFPWFPVRVSIRLRLASDDSPLVLQSIFDRSSIPERRSNGEWTEDERSPNGGWTELERRLNGARTEPERRLNGARTEVERSSNGGWTEVERRMNGARTEDERRMNGKYTIGIVGRTAIQFHC